MQIVGDSVHLEGERKMMKKNVETEISAVCLYGAHGSVMTKPNRRSRVGM